MKKFLPMVAAMTLAACGGDGVKSIPPAPEIIIERNAPVADQKVTPMELSDDLEWKVRDIAALRILLDEMEARGEKGMVLYVLTRDDYELLAMNIAEMRRYITDQQGVIEYLEEGHRVNNPAPVE
jgi:predicted small lipoprotein YifL